MSETVEDTGQEQEQGTAATAPAEVAAPAETTETQPQEKKTPWEIRRINAMTRQMREAERRAELAERRAQELTARLAAAAATGEGGEAAAPPRPAITQADFDNAVNARAAEQAFNNTCNAIYREGVDTFEDFGERIENFRKIGGMQPALVEIAQELGNPAKILYDLAGDPDEAARIMELPPARMAAAVARMVAKASPAGRRQEPSKAPPPVTRVTGTASAEPDPEKMSHAEWRVWREAQIAQKKAARSGR